VKQWLSLHISQQLPGGAEDGRCSLRPSPLLRRRVGAGAEGARHNHWNQGSGPKQRAFSMLKQRPSRGR
jgi:hypothetical protein